MEEWYYAVDGAQHGPVSREALLQLLNSRQIPSDTLVWREGMKDWIGANLAQELSAPAAHPIHASPQMVGQAAPTPMLNYGVSSSLYQPVSQLEYMGFWIRLAALVIDAFALGCVAMVVLIPLQGLVAVTSRGNGAGPQLAMQFVGTFIGWLYTALMMSSSSQGTLGMLALGIKITDLQGRPITFARATGRYFANILNACTCGISYLTIAFTQKKQGLHDMIAETVIIRK